MKIAFPKLIIAVILCSAFTTGYSQIGIIKKGVEGIKKKNDDKKNTNIGTPAPDTTVTLDQHVNTTTSQKNEKDENGDGMITSAEEEAYRKKLIQREITAVQEKSSDSYKANAGKIIFTTNANQLEAATNYSFDKALFANIYLSLPKNWSDSQKEWLISDSYDSYKKAYVLQVFFENYMFEGASNEEEFSNSQIDSTLQFQVQLRDDKGQYNQENSFGAKQFQKGFEKYSKFNSGLHPITFKIFPAIVHTGNGSSTKIGDVAISEGTLTMNFPTPDINNPEICMPKPAMKDDALVKEIIKTYSSSNPGQEVVKVAIISSNWRIIKNKYSSQTESRVVDVLLGVKKDGKCYTDSRSFGQDFVNGQFQKNVFQYAVGSWNEIFCGCLDKN